MQHHLAVVLKGGVYARTETNKTFSHGEGRQEERTGFPSLFIATDILSVLENPVSFSADNRNSRSGI